MLTSKGRVAALQRLVSQRIDLHTPLRAGVRVYLPDQNVDRRRLPLIAANKMARTIPVSVGIGDERYIATQDFRGTAAR